MATTSALINLGSCSVASADGTGSTYGCIKQLTSARSLWLFNPSYGFPAASTLNEALVNEAIADGNLVILKGVNTFEENGDDDNIETLDDTTKQVTNEGKYSFTATFTNGLYFNAALHSLKGFGNWNVAIVTSKGDIFGTTNASGDFTGFDTGMLQPTKLQFGTTTTGQKEGVMFQFLDRNEVDEDYAFLQRANLDFNPLQKDGVNDVTLTYVNAPANTDTTVTVKAVLTNDLSTVVSGGTYSDFLITVDGSTQNPSAGDDSTTAGTYVLTGVTALSTGEVIATKLYDNSNSRSIVSIDSVHYKSNTVSATVTA